MQRDISLLKLQKGKGDMEDIGPKLRRWDDGESTGQCVQGRGTVSRF